MSKVQPTKWMRNASNGGAFMILSGDVSIEVFNLVNRKGWMWRVYGLPVKEWSGSAMTKKQAKIDAMRELSKSIELLTERLRQAQQNTPGFSATEK